MPSSVSDPPRFEFEYVSAVMLDPSEMTPLNVSVNGALDGPVTVRVALDEPLFVTDV